MKRALLILLFLLAITPFIAFQLVFDVPEQPSLIIQDGEVWSETTRCFENPDAVVLDDNGSLNLLVWNIYKQNRKQALPALTAFSKESHLLLLQEVSMTEEFKHWIGSKDWDSSLVRAFDAFETSAGVISLSAQLPEKVCAYTETEPVLRLPKSALFTLYPLSDGQKLAVINIHAINFTVGTATYERQLKVLQKIVSNHEGPLILAGDFNTWSNARLDELKQVVVELELTEVEFKPDNRKTFLTGIPLDHIYYKNLRLVNTKAPKTDASDHNPLIASFKIEQ